MLLRTPVVGPGDLSSLYCCSVNWRLGALQGIRPRSGQGKSKLTTPFQTFRRLQNLGEDDGSGSLDRDIVSDYVMAALDNVSATYVLTVNGEVVGADLEKGSKGCAEC